MEFFLAIVKFILFTRCFKPVLDGIKGVSLQVCTSSFTLIGKNIFCLHSAKERVKGSRFGWLA